MSNHFLTFSFSHFLSLRLRIFNSRVTRLDDKIDGVFWRVGEVDQAEVLVVDHLFVEHGGGQPGEQATPVLRAKKHYRKVANLTRLDQRQGLKKLVHRAK